jgi:hypothetical protein
MRESLVQRGRIISRIIVVLSILTWATPALIAQDRAAEALHQYSYSVASIRGDYAVVNHYGANLALGVGTVHFDGTGTLSGSLLLNKPASTGARELVPLTLTGTYSVNGDGTGTIFFTVTLPDSSIKTATEDFVITRTEVIRRFPVATEIIDAQREASLVLGNGVFVTQKYTRRGEEPRD